METKGVWHSFVETGDPLCYLLVKKIERQPRENGTRKKSDSRNGEQPRPEC